jgi:outer membrane protein OmpA-like peptidoglycan-associated protein
MSSQAQTIELENSDRIKRFERLSAVAGAKPPRIDQLQAPPGSVPGVPQAVPVVRVLFDERAFFSSGSDVPLPQANAMFDLIAENMKRDVPDAALTLLGHTDAVGGDAFNLDLSRRRAAAVMRALTERGVNPNQLSVVAIGKAQPIASNADAAGRARNRRVEFMISGSEAANLAVVSHRRVNRDFFQTATNVAAVPPPARVTVLKLSALLPSKGNDLKSLTEAQTIDLPPPVKRVDVAVAQASPQSSQWTDAPFDADEKTNPPGSKWVDAP